MEKRGQFGIVVLWILFFLFVLVLLGFILFWDTFFSENSAGNLTQQISNDVCSQNSDCVPVSCCHATACVPKAKAPSCYKVFCTEMCQPGTLDCGGTCSCINNKCTAAFK